MIRRAGEATLDDLAVNMCVISYRNSPNPQHNIMVCVSLLFPLITLITAISGCDARVEGGFGVEILNSQFRTRHTRNIEAHWNGRRYRTLLPFLFAYRIDGEQNDELGGMVVKVDFHGLSPDAQLRSCGSDDQAAPEKLDELATLRVLPFRLEAYTLSR
jgi:hypothetical protein